LQDGTLIGVKSAKAHLLPGRRLLSGELLPFSVWPHAPFIETLVEIFGEICLDVLSPALLTTGRCRYIVVSVQAKEENVLGFDGNWVR